jgi:hypothetical protein
MLKKSANIFLCLTLFACNGTVKVETEKLKSTVKPEVVIQPKDPSTNIDIVDCEFPKEPVPKNPELIAERIVTSGAVSPEGQYTQHIRLYSNGAARFKVYRGENNGMEMWAEILEGDIAKIGDNQGAEIYFTSIKTPFKFETVQLFIDTFTECLGNSSSQDFIVRHGKSIKIREQSCNFAELPANDSEEIQAVLHLLEKMENKTNNLIQPISPPISIDQKLASH